MFKFANLTIKLICPDNPNVLLEYNGEHNCFESTMGHQYFIKNNVLVILPENAENKTTQSDVHRELQSNFSYISHYQTDASEFDYFEQLSGEEAHETKRLHEFIVKNVKLSSNSILDVGCGKGWVAENLCKTGKQVISMDVALVNPQKVFEKFPYDNHFAITADVYHLPFAADSIECIIASEIIEHVHDPELFIQKLFNALSVGGRLIISTPYEEKIKYTLCIHCNKPTPISAHLHSFTKEKMTQYLDSLGIKKYTMVTHSSKLLLKLRSFYMLRLVPYTVWRLVDRLFCSLFGNEQRLIICIDK